jgi:type II secretory ATPase GspE/PulE/Tfp pilus assembly ATPase PilB-like protein
MERDVLVYFRIDGVLQEQRSIHHAYQQPVLNRLKVLAGMDIAERRLPQDGVFGAHIQGEEVRFRVSTLPTDFGEKAVIRILVSQRLIVDIDRLGAPPDVVTRMRSLLNRPTGMFLVSGPTGSGKTSTLYAMVRELLNKKLNIVTLEDPIEFRFRGVAQSQVNLGAGYDFAVGLRAILRQDPDVIMLGEIRDLETARIAFKAALTGHLVLSSLHTRNATEVLVRLIDMGLERYVVASALRAVISQRLVRTICSNCPTQGPLTAETRERLRVLPKRDLRVLAGGGSTVILGKGCARCNGTGYHGRTGLFELVEVDEDMQELIRQEGTGQTQFANAYYKRGLPDIRQAGFAKALSGITTFDEVLDVT